MTLIRNKHGADKVLASTFLFPSLLAVLAVIVYPLIVGLLYSVQNGTLFQAGRFIGLANFFQVFTMDDFWNSLRFSVLFALVSVIGSYVLGLLLALFLNKDVPFKNIFRAVILVPWILPSIVGVVAWRWMLGDQQSIVNNLLTGIGFDPVLFLADPSWAFFSVCLVKVWRSFPFMMVSLLAVMQTIPEEQYEAADMDGASGIQRFFFITWPHLVPITVICGILMTIWSVNDFDTIYLLTNGGPVDSTQNMITLAYKFSFTKNDIGIGSAIAILAMVVLMILATFSLNRQRRTE